MPRKISRASSPRVRPVVSTPPVFRWPLYVLTVVLGAALGSGITYAALRPSLHAVHGAMLNPIVTAQAEREAGNLAFDNKDWNVAVQDYSQAISAGYDNPDIRTDLGTAYRNLNQPQKAMQEYQIAQRQDPDHQNSLVNEAIVTAFSLNNPSQGLALFHLYLSRFPHGDHVTAVKKLMARLQPGDPLKSASSPAA